VTTNPGTSPRPHLLVAPFPDPGPHLRLAYRDLLIASTGTKDQVKALGNISTLPRPWDPPTCCDHELRRQLWDWLEAVVTWLIHDYAWDVADIIPPCCPTERGQSGVGGDRPRRKLPTLRVDGDNGLRVLVGVRAETDREDASWPARMRLCACERSG